MVYNVNLKDDFNLDEAEKQDLTNPFPVDVFPSPFKELISGCNEALNFPTDYVGAAILTAVCTVIGRSAKLKVKNGWYQFANFFMALLGNAGASKSPAMELPFKPIEKHDMEQIKIFEAAYNEYEVIQKDKKDNKDNHPAVKPNLIKTMLHNFTMEILGKRLADNDRGLVIVSDELATSMDGISNYSKADQTPQMLSYYSNKSSSVDRVGSPIPLMIIDPILNWIGGLQYRVLSRLFPKSKTDNGLLQRFLFAAPDHAEKQPINDVELNPEIFDKYSKWITTYLSNPIDTDFETGLPKPRIYIWSIEAKAYFYEWHKQNTAMVNENADSLKGEIISKFDIHFVRLSLVLQIMDSYEKNEISLKAVQGAAKLCTYFLNNAMKVLDILESNQQDALPQNKLKLYSLLPDHFTTAEANAIGESIGENVKFVQRFLMEDLFIKTAYGQYSKKGKTK